MSVASKGVFIVGAKRTPFGTFGGMFKNTTATELQAIATTAALKEAGVAPAQVDTVIVGQVISATQTDGIYTPRHSALKAGIPQEKPVLGINRLCGSGFQSIVNSAQDILTGSAKISVAGGVENMSQSPYAVRGVRFGTVLGSTLAFEDTLWSGLTDSYCGLPMGMTAEKLGAQFKITRDEVDQFALKSQQRWKKSNDAGVFKAEIEPVTITVKRKEVKVDTDEHPRPQTTIESLKKLPPVFKKEGLVTAGSASGISDGAGALVLADEESAKGLRPLARLVGWACVGVDPSIMGIGPVPAIENLLKATKMTLNDVDLIEINEAFVAQTLSCAKALKLDMEKLNVNGGATALGHPLGASGSRITAHLVHELKRRGLKRGIGSACIGGGQGVFIVSAKRSPFGKMGGKLKDTLPSDLLATVFKDALRAGNVSPNIVDSVNVGQVYSISGSADGTLTQRHAALKAGIPQEKPAVAVNRLCGSGFQAVINSAQDILTGAAQVSLAGGSENMSAVPFVVRNARFGIPLGVNTEFEDILLRSSLDTFCKFTMPETAENLAEKYGLKRGEVDEFALQSQIRWKSAHDNGVFKTEMTPVTVKVKRQEMVIDTDEHPRPDTNMEALSKLPVLFRKGGVVTAGNSSGVNDGAGALVLASEEAVKQHNLTPLVRLLAWSFVGVDPSVMGIGPVPAINNVLKVSGLTLNDIDLVEINEAFAAQTLACVKELNLDQNKLNVNGGAIALGHPVGASGARITAHLAHELRRRNLKRGIGSACIGGGQGIALLLETV